MFKKHFKVILWLLLAEMCLVPAMAAKDTPEKEILRRVEKERISFKEILLENPNYFGNAPKAVTKEYAVVKAMSYTTTYEELTCVGLSPQDNILEAVIEIKLSYGYSGSLCSDGSHEYVAFYIDYGDGAGFIEAATASVNTHDLAWVSNGPVYYAVRQSFTPPKYLKCDTPQIVRLRAVLSWQQIPTGPEFTPVWGNVLDTWVQIKPKVGPVIFQDPTLPIIKFTDIELPLDLGFQPKIEEIPEIEPPWPPSPIGPIVIVGDPEDIKAMLDHSFKSKQEAMNNKRIEPERLEFKSMIQKNPNYFGSLSKSKDSMSIMKDICSLPPQTFKELASQLKTNKDWLIPVKPMLLKTNYEELTCVGLYPEDDLLEAVLTIKRPYGYSGDLCSLGSREYVAFYVDWGSGYEHEATATVRVYDIPGTAEKNLSYAVKATISDIESKLKPCEVEQIVKVKAILSWNTDPTPYGHTYPPTWGNVLVQNVQIRPSTGQSAACSIDIVNGVMTEHISQSGSDTGLAIKPGTIFTFDRPFGGIIACWGNMNLIGAHYYRFLYSENGGASWTAILDKRRAVNPFWPWGSAYLERTPDTEGWFSKSLYDSDKALYTLLPMLNWRSYGKDGQYELKLQVAKSDMTVIGEDQVTLILDNTSPTLLEFGGTPAPLPAEGVVVKDSDGNYRKCTTFVGQEPIDIYGNFRDAYFYACSLEVFGGNIHVSGHSLGSWYYDSTPSILNNQGIIGAWNGGPGDNLYTLDLCTVDQPDGKVKCAYGIRLRVSDRAIVGYLKNYEFWKTCHGRQAYVTFDWDPEGCPAE